MIGQRMRVSAASRAGAPHLVYVSIVGSDNISSWSYPKAKLEAERVVADSGLPWTILRATQFYEYILAGVRKLAWLPVVPVLAGFPVQPIDTDEVAARLVELTLGAPAGRVPDLAGPQVITWADLVRDYLRASRRRPSVVPIRIPGTGAVRAGGLLPSPGHAVGRQTWEEFLTASVHRPDHYSADRRRGPSGPRLTPGHFCSGPGHPRGERSARPDLGRAERSPLCVPFDDVWSWSLCFHSPR